MSATEPRDLWPALRKGIARRCPRCGEAPLFAGYLAVRESCDNCGLEFHHHRADDMHPWMTILIVGHVVGVSMLLAMQKTQLSDTFHMIAWPSLALVLCLAILPLAKGFVIALQWALRMHGFAHER